MCDQAGKSLVDITHPVGNAQARREGEVFPGRADRIGEGDIETMMRQTRPAPGQPFVEAPGIVDGDDFVEIRIAFQNLRARTRNDVAPSTVGQSGPESGQRRGIIKDITDVARSEENAAAPFPRRRRGSSPRQPSASPAQGCPQLFREAGEAVITRPLKILTTRPRPVRTFGKGNTHRRSLHILMRGDDPN